MAAFKELIPFYAVVSYNKSGFGHVAGYLDKYEDFYAGHGFLLSKLSEITNKNRFYTALATSKASDIAALAAEFNAYKESAVNNVNGAGGQYDPCGGGKNDLRLVCRR